MDSENYEVVIDTVEYINEKIDDKSNVTEYDVYLTENGKVSLCEGDYGYRDLRIGNTVYVVIIKGKFGEKYIARQLYLTKFYKYYE